MSGDLPAVLRLGEDLVRNFAWQGEDQAAAAVAEHIRRFWEPRMTAELTALVVGDDPRVDARLRQVVTLLTARGRSSGDTASAAAE